jgi:hypothetical protein
VIKVNKKEDKKKESRPTKIMTLDTETRGLFGDIFRVGLYTGTRYHGANSFEELKGTLLDYSTKYDCHIFIHNLDFDLSKMAHELIPNADLKKSIFINNNVTVFSTSVTTAQHTEERDIISQPITFHDSNKLIQGRLKQICKDFHIEEKKAKIELKDHIMELGWGHDKDGNPTNDPEKYDEFESEGYYFEHVDPWESELNQYLRNDCISLYEVVTMLKKLSGLPQREFLTCPTTPSLAMRMYKTNFPEDYAKAISTKYLGQENIERFIRRAYYGGRTEVFTPLLLDGYHYDVNSLYPYVMKSFPIVYGRPLMTVGETAENQFYHWLNYHQGGGFLECDIEIPESLWIPPLPHRAKYEKALEHKLIFPCGKLNGVWTFEELELALDMGAEIHHIYRCVFFDKTAYLFKNYIEYFEEIKINSEGAERKFAKDMSNTLYGKFGMKRIRKTLLPAKYKEKCEAKGYAYTEYYNPLFPDEFIEAEIPSKAEYIQPHIAAYVTSLARIVLYKGLISQYMKGTVAYCDTDSVACGAEMDADQVHDKEYGKWKLESELIEGVFIQPKTYYEQHKEFLKNKETNEFILDENGNKIHKETKKFKGIPKKHINNLSREKYMDILNHLKELQYKKENKIPISKEEAYYSIYTGEKKRQKFASVLKAGETDFDLPLEINKGILLLNAQKRRMDYINNSSRPHVLNEWGDLFDRQQEEQLQLLFEKEMEKMDPIKEKVQEIGYIQIPGKDDPLYMDYKQIQNSFKKKYFRRKGMPLDVWCDNAGYEYNSFLYELK